MQDVSGKSIMLPIRKNILFHVLTTGEARVLEEAECPQCRYGSVSVTREPIGHARPPKFAAHLHCVACDWKVLSGVTYEIVDGSIQFHIPLRDAPQSVANDSAAGKSA